MADIDLHDDDDTHTRTKNVKYMNQLVSIRMSRLYLFLTFNAAKNSQSGAGDVGY